MRGRGSAGGVQDEAFTIASVLHRLGLPDGLVSPLLSHAAAVRANADRLGLVAAGDLDRLVSRHTADSLLFALVRAPQPSERWVDVGSGAGFPGLVLACCYPESGFWLVEPMRRRAAFLEFVAESVGLCNASVVGARAEGLEASFDVGVARALADPPAALALIEPLVRPGGEAIVACSPSAEIPERARLVEAGTGLAASPAHFLRLEVSPSAEGPLSS